MMQGVSASGGSGAQVSLRTFRHSKVAQGHLKAHTAPTTPEGCYRISLGQKGLLDPSEPTGTHRHTSLPEGYISHITARQRGVCRHASHILAQDCSTDTALFYVP